MAEPRTGEPFRRRLSTPGWEQLGRSSASQSLQLGNPRLGFSGQFGPNQPLSGLIRDPTMAEARLREARARKEAARLRAEEASAALKATIAQVSATNQHSKIGEVRDRTLERVTETSGLRGLQRQYAGADLGRDEDEAAAAAASEAAAAAAAESKEEREERIAMERARRLVMRNMGIPDKKGPRVREGPHLVDHVKALRQFSSAGEDAYVTETRAAFTRDAEFDEEVARNARRTTGKLKKNAFTEYTEAVARSGARAAAEAAKTKPRK
mmetsp:Transcript_5547/g.23526  ORF Transcript_5547/g.23526 Transcript_5547/m.23526 type:complete len:268 (-) Transcript_5547:146-949(-)